MSIFYVFVSLIGISYLALILNNYLGYHLYFNGNKYKNIAMELESLSNYFAILNAFIVILDTLISFIFVPPLTFLAPVMSFILISILFLRSCNRSHNWFMRIKKKEKIYKKLGTHATKDKKRSQAVNINKETQRYIMATFIIIFIAILILYCVFSIKLLDK